MKRFLFVLSLLLSFSVNAVDPKPGINFKKTKEEIATDSPGKIEVVEMFWYGCIHCYKIDPYLDEWADNLPEDVVFKKVPAVPRKNWVPMAKAYYALETLELDKKLHEKLFDAIHIDGEFLVARNSDVSIYGKDFKLKQSINSLPWCIHQ